MYVPIAIALASLLAPTVKSHATEVRHCITNAGKLRIFVAHWHGDLTSVASGGTMTIQDLNNQGSSITRNADGLINNVSNTQIHVPGECVDGKTIPDSKCSNLQSSYSDWVYYDFDTSCTLQVNYRIVMGNNIGLQQACTNLLPVDIVHFTDIVPPIPTVNGDICSDSTVVSAETNTCEDNTATINFNIAADDSCDASPTIAASPSSGDAFPVGNSSVIVTATNDLGKTASCNFTVSVNRKTCTPSTSPSLAPTMPSSQNIGGGGDPHFITFLTELTWQAECDFKMFESRKAANGIHDVLVQGRTTKKRHYSFIEEAAIMIGPDTWEFNAKDGSIIFNGNDFLDDQLATIIQGEFYQGKNYTLATTYKGTDKLIVTHDIDLGDGKTIEVRCNLRYHMLFLDFKGTFPDETDGLLGSPHKSTLFTRDGIAVMPKSEEEVNAYCESWQVRDTDPKLFQVARMPQYPTKCQYSTSLVIDARLRGSRKLLEEEEEEVNNISLENAIAVCAKHHGEMRRFCITDVIAIGDVSVADDEFYGY